KGLFLFCFSASSSQRASSPINRLLKRASFSSADDLQQRILRFIVYFNKTCISTKLWRSLSNGLTRVNLWLPNR
ncbi:MAG TPA: hypothetical protein ENK24_02225, partial [Anaerolineae bacterium]|nr:hypothetical protein [Anaerolineae bacterium]